MNRLGLLITLLLACSSSPLGLHAPDGGAPGAGGDGAVVSPPPLASGGSSGNGGGGGTGGADVGNDGPFVIGGSNGGPDVQQVLDSTVFPDVPMITPDAHPSDAIPGVGGAVETGGGQASGTGGTTATGGATGTPDASPTLLPNGASCTIGTACASGTCADDVCCANPCSACLACTRALTGQPDGTCATVPNGRDPHNTCTGASCNGSKFTPTSYCTGEGGCTSVTPQDCGTFQCSTTDGCKTTCTGQADCVGQSYCNTSTGTCQPKVPTGGARTQPIACVSGSCADGVCA